MSNSVVPKLRRILSGGRGRLSTQDAGRAAMALAVLGGLAFVTEPTAALARSAPARAFSIAPERPDEALSRALGSTTGGDVALVRAILAERVAAKRVVVEAMRAGLSTEVPEADAAPSPKGIGVPLRDVRPIEDAVDASYEGALGAYPGHVDLVMAVKAQRDAEAEVGRQADLVTGAGPDGEPETDAPTFR